RSAEQSCFRLSLATRHLSLALRLGLNARLDNTMTAPGPNSVSRPRVRRLNRKPLQQSRRSMKHQTDWLLTSTFDVGRLLANLFGVKRCAFSESSQGFSSPRYGRESRSRRHHVTRSIRRETHFRIQSLRPMCPLASANKLHRASSPNNVIV